MTGLHCTRENGVNFSLGYILEDWLTMPSAAVLESDVSEAESSTGGAGRWSHS